VKFAQNCLVAWWRSRGLPKIYDGRSKTFFFFNYEGLRRREAGTLLTSSVQPNWSGRRLFRDRLQRIRPVIYDQRGTVLFDAAQNQYIRQTLLNDGKRIPQSMLHPVSLALLKYVPLPNATPTPDEQHE